MLQTQFEELLQLPDELSGVEFKGPGPRTDTYLFAKVARAVMGMANKRDGGIVIVGVEERNKVFTPKGLSEEEVASWRKYDHVRDALAGYMNPPVSLDLNIYEFQGRPFVVLEVHEFADVPVLCKKAYEHPHSNDYKETVLRKGACYVRSRHKPETVEIASSEHMRELLDLATEKGVRRFVTQAQKAGLDVSKAVMPQDKELFAEQSKDWTSPFVEELHTPGYWQTTISPTAFVPDRINHADLYPILEDVSVTFYGWSFPGLYNPSMNNLQRGQDWIAQGDEWNSMLEAWRFYQSGQFLHVAGLLDDWREEVLWQRPSEERKQGELLAIEEVVSRFTLIFEFAARLALNTKYTGNDKLHVDVVVNGLQGRKLYISNPGKVPLRWEYKASIPQFSYLKHLSRDELAAQSKNLALQASVELFQRFGWQPSMATLESIQQGLFS